MPSISASFNLLARRNDKGIRNFPLQNSPFGLDEDGYKDGGGRRSSSLSLSSSEGQVAEV